MDVQENELESRRFGFRFARLREAVLAPGEINALLQEADGRGIDVITTRVPSGDIALVQELENSGFRLMDMVVYYKKHIDDIPVRKHADVRELTPESAAACAHIASRAFGGYFGHYHADRKLSKTSADEVYVDWISRMISSPSAGQISLGSFAGDQQTGFLVGAPREQGCSEAVLGAVDPSSQKQGFYERLIEEFFRHSAQQGQREMIVSTQIQNYAVQRVWTRAGFRLSESYYTLHRWRSR